MESFFDLRSRGYPYSIRDFRWPLGPPILFNPYPDGTAAGFTEWPLDVGLALRNATAEEKRKRGMWFLYMASASHLAAFGTPPATVRPQI